MFYTKWFLFSLILYDLGEKLFVCHKAPRKDIEAILIYKQKQGGKKLGVL